MNISKLNLIFCLCLLFAHPCRANAPINVSSPENLYNFAKHLHDQGDYTRSATEFQRYIFLAGKQPEQFGELENAMFLNAKSLLQAGETQKALAAFIAFGSQFPSSHLAPDGMYLLAQTLENQGQDRKAQQWYKRIISLWPKHDVSKKAQLHIRLVEIVNGTEENQPPAKTLNTVLPKSLEDELKSQLKNPTTAGVMSAIIPGAGHAYAGRNKDALFAFLSNGLMIASAYQAFEQDLDALGVVLSFLELGWYTGTIYSSINLTHQYNRERRNEMEHRLLQPGSDPAIGIQFKYLYD